jgi:tRNA (guanine-N7-)-methyltransferase
LLAEVLPQLRFDPTAAGNPAAAFSPHVARVWLEVGCGNGEHALAQIARHPEIGLIGAEVFANGLASMLAHLEPETRALPGNLRLWDDDARALIRILPDASLDRLFVLFPDPWPKARHAKRRFVHPAFLPEIARVLRPGAEWRIATDDPTHQAWLAEVFAAQTLFAAPPPATARPADWPPTRYEAKALAAGRRAHYWTLRRAGPSR